MFMRLHGQVHASQHNYYGIEFDGDKYHSATYDVTKTYEILKRMNINI